MLSYFKKKKKNKILYDELKTKDTISKKINRNLIYFVTLVPSLIFPFEQSLLAVNYLGSITKNKTIHSNIKKDISKNLSQLEKSWMAYKVPHKINVSPITRLPVLADGNVALPSNANNFHGSWNANVDPRTGRASFSVALGSLLFNRGLDRRDLELSYSGQASPGGANHFYLGSEWTWNVGTEHASTTEIAGKKTTDVMLSDGHSFTMINNRSAMGNNWKLYRHKLKDVVVLGHPGDWTVSTASGLREHIKNGYEDWEESRGHKRVWMYYDRDSYLNPQRRLKYICAHPLTNMQLQQPENVCAGEGVRITYENNTVVVHSTENVVLTVGEIAGNNQITKISMPSLSSNKVSNGNYAANLYFKYDAEGKLPWLLHSVSYPTGVTSTFYYNNETSKSDARTSGLPTGINNSTLPVVTELVNHDGLSTDKDQHVWYRYGQKGQNQHNYTGYQDGALMVPGKDNLTDKPDNYTYSVTQDSGYTSKTTTYNKYHLPLKEMEVSDTTNNIIGKSETNYPEWQNTTFNQLKPTYSLPTKVSKVFFTPKNAGLEASSAVSQETRYNEFGQPIWKRNVAGDKMIIQYCTMQKSKHCQTQSAKWPNLNLPEKVLVIPFTNKNDGADSKPAAHLTVFDYTKIKTKPSIKRMLLESGVKSSAMADDNGSVEISKKTLGTIPLDKIANLKPGDKIPELEASDLSTQTSYVYDEKSSSNDYGLLKSMTIVKYPESTPKVNHKLLNLSFLANKVELSKPETLTLNLRRKENATTNERSENIVIDNSNSSPDALNHAKELVDESGISLGKEVYSIKNGMKISEEDALSALHTKWKYDAWRRPISQTTIPANGAASKTITWDYINTRKENAIIRTEPNGSQVKTLMNGRMKVISKWYRFKADSNKPIEGLDGWIPQAKIFYNGAKGQKTTEKNYVPGNNGTRTEVTTSYGYDETKRPVWIKKADGQIDIFYRDDAGMRIFNYHVVGGNDYQQEKLGYKLQVVDLNSRGKPKAVYALPLDPMFKKDGSLLYSGQVQGALNQLRSSLAPASSLKSINSSGLLSPISLIDFAQMAINNKAWLNHIEYKYDSAGRKIEQIDGNGAVTHWTWNKGNLVAVTTPDKRIIHDSFNIRGEKIGRCAYAINGAICHPLGYRKYNNAGDLIKQTDETGQAIRFSYDADGRVIKKTLPAADDSSKGHVITYKYNSIGVIEKDLDGVPYVLYNYDKNTWQLTDVEDNVSHQHYSYSPETGLPIKIVRSAPKKLKPYAGIEYPGGVVQFTWDKFGAPINMTDEEGNVFTQVYDNLGRIVKKLVYLHGSKKPLELVTTAYDLYSQPISITTGAGITKSFTRDRVGRVVSTTESRNGNAFQKYIYGYDSVTDNIISIKRSEGNLSSPKDTTSAEQLFTYDITGNLTGMKCEPLNAKSRSLCPHDTGINGSALTKAPVILAQKYNFDNWNNINKVTEILGVGNNHVVTKTVKYVYASQKMDKANPEMYDPHRMVGFYEHWSTQKYDSKPYGITYDKLGRIIVDASGNKLHYNAFGRQDSFTNASTQNITRYTYDSEGHQIAEQSFYGSGKSKGKAIQNVLYMFYDGNRVSRQVQKDTNGHRHVSEELSGVAHAEDGVINHWYLYNYKGDVVSIINDKGNVVEDNVYSPYGIKYNRMAVNESSSSVDSPLWKIHEPGFDGQMTDPATGYQFLGGGYRAYNPVYRHFMSKDSYSPFKLIDGYGFVSNNPIMNTDPTGHINSKVLGIVMGAVAIVASVAISVVFPVSAFITAASASSVASTVGATAGVSVGSAVASTVAGVTGAGAGSLQIASSVKPNNLALKTMNDVVGVVGSIAMIGMGDVAGVTSAIGFVSTGGNITSALSATATTLNTAAFASAGVASGMSAAADADPSLSKKGFNTAIEALGIASGALGVASIGASVGALAAAPAEIKSQWTSAKERVESYKAEKAAMKNSAPAPDSAPSTEPVNQDVDVSSSLESTGGITAADEPVGGGAASAGENTPNRVTQDQIGEGVGKEHEMHTLYSEKSNTAYVSRSDSSGHDLIEETRNKDGTKVTGNNIKQLKKGAVRQLKRQGYKLKTTMSTRVEFVNPAQMNLLRGQIKGNGIEINFKGMTEG